MLQWSRDDEVAESKMLGSAAEPVVMLQWSRDDEVAERKPVLIGQGRFGELQWSRDDEVAESVIASSEMRRKPKSFNGAATMRSRKAPDRKGPRDGAPGASMEPRR